MTDPYNFFIEEADLKRERRKAREKAERRVQAIEAAILEDSLRVIEQFHDPERYSMCRMALAPCSPFSVTEQLMVQTAELAREHRQEAGQGPQGVRA